MALMAHQALATTGWLLKPSCLRLSLSIKGLDLLDNSANIYALLAASRRLGIKKPSITA